MIQDKVGFYKVSHTHTGCVPGTQHLLVDVAPRCDTQCACLQTDAAVGLHQQPTSEMLTRFLREVNTH